MPTQSDEKNWDIRTLERKLRRGLVSRKDYEKHVKSLPDRADRATYIGLGAGGRDDFDDAMEDEGDRGNGAAR